MKSKNIYLKVERNFSEYTLKSYHDDLVQFNEFLNSEHLELTTFEYKDAEIICLIYIQII